MIKLKSLDEIRQSVEKSTEKLRKAIDNLCDTHGKDEL